MLMTKVLMLYCSPVDQERLRIDREHREIDSVISKAGLDPSMIHRKQAATLGDLIEALSAESFSVVHFSGHGCAERLAFDSKEHGTEAIGIRDLVEVLRSSQTE